METRLRKWGNSHGIRLPKDVLEQANLHEGDRVDVSVKKGRIVIAPAQRKYDLATLLRGMKAANLHGEAWDGSPAGSEEW